jgi:hypothetical protein
MILTPDELAELTARTRPRAQAEVLAALGIPYRTRPDGTLVVLRQVVLAVLGAQQERRGPRLRLPA